MGDLRILLEQAAKKPLVIHKRRMLRAMVDEVLRSLSPQFNRMYAREGRPSIAPVKLLRALWCRCSTRSAASGC